MEVALHLSGLNDAFEVPVLRLASSLDAFKYVTNDPVHLRNRELSALASREDILRYFEKRGIPGLKIVKTMGRYNVIENHGDSGVAILSFSPGSPSSAWLALATNSLDTRFKLQDEVSTSRVVNIGWPNISPDGLSVYWASVEVESFPKTKDEFYPFIKEGLDSFIEGYFKSRAAILILLGPPGTGKTQLVREIIRRSNWEDIFYLASTSQFDAEVIGRFISDVDALVIEDVPDSLMKRTDGNENLSLLLAASDGLLSGKKIIITSNMSNPTEIDPALIRPGRTYRLLETRPLTEEEAKRAAVAAGVEKDITGDVTLAELFSSAPHEGTWSVGFI